ncbi:Crp/Fnr family transcriptional regulator [Sphingomonas sp. XMGL2]|uniref:Crp/Fnr family transcriptional regulator n=1 Tax=Sphingomonas quercus TaxID=2842451 RepID=A0ABS6BKD8_9SPHN|nr:Crp/Fnr family transcriptional regulator [Sphingomonas quercus]
MPAFCAECPVRTEAVCAALDPVDRTTLAKVGHHRTYARGETIFAAGDESIACATLVSGAVKLSATGRDGVERIVALVHPAGLLGHLFSAEISHDAVALTESRLCLFPRRDFERLMLLAPALLQGVLERTVRELDRARALADLIGRRDARSRVAGLLLSFSQAAGSACHPAPTFELPLTRGEAASLLGLTIETVSRQLSALESDGLIRKHGLRGIHILEPVALASMMS